MSDEKNENTTVEPQNVPVELKKDEKKEKKAKKAKKGFSLRINFVQGYSKLQSSIPVLLITCISSFIVMGLVALGIFFFNVKGPERVLVPDVVGKNLEDALLELQVKEIYPTVNFRYSEDPSDNGLVLEQTPKAGSIVKGYSRITLAVSRGVLVDSVGDYIGQNLSDLMLKLDTLFTGQLVPTISLLPPEYRPDESEAGTILEQNPPAGTSIYEPTSVQLVVSSGPNYEDVKVPNVVGQSINDLMQTVTRNKLIFDVSIRPLVGDEEPGTVVSQESLDSENISSYSRIAIEMAMPIDPIEDNYYGLFEQDLIEYPYPVPMSLTAIPLEGRAYTLVEFNHTGGKLTVPYAVPAGTTLVLTVANKVLVKEVIN